ncbi:MAG TPA: hypothetical protein VM123_07065 [archaeon]|nr:hypothetical protein [archaeon]
MRDKKKLKKTICFLSLYYLSFVVFIQFPAAHSLVDDLYEGKISSYVILQGVHRHPTNTDQGVLEHHKQRLISVDKCLLCTIHDRNYPRPVKIASPLLSLLSIARDCLAQEFFHLQPPSAIFHRRAPPEIPA